MQECLPKTPLGLSPNLCVQGFVDHNTSLLLTMDVQSHLGYEAKSAKYCLVPRNCFPLDDQVFAQQLVRINSYDRCFSLIYTMYYFLDGRQYALYAHIFLYLSRHLTRTHFMDFSKNIKITWICTPYGHCLWTPHILQQRTKLTNYNNSPKEVYDDEHCIKLPYIKSYVTP